MEPLRASVYSGPTRKLKRVSEGPRRSPPTGLGHHTPIPALATLKPGAASLKAGAGAGLSASSLPPRGPAVRGAGRRRLLLTKVGDRRLCPVSLPGNKWLEGLPELRGGWEGRKEGRKKKKKEEEKPSPRAVRRVPWITTGAGKAPSPRDGGRRGAAVSMKAAGWAPATASSTAARVSKEKGGPGLETAVALGRGDTPPCRLSPACPPLPRRESR